MLHKFLVDFDTNLFLSAFDFFLSALDIEDRRSDIQVTIVKKIGKNIGGQCTPLYYEPYEVTSVHIKIVNNTSTIGMIEVLAHEMVHAKQFLKGDIRYTNKRLYKWGFIPYDKVLTFWHGEDVTDVRYYETPYEVEAFLLQRQMTASFLRHVEDTLYAPKMAESYKNKLQEKICQTTK